jgi:hypothetical protein
VGLGKLLKRLLGRGHDLRELARRLGMVPEDLPAISPAYTAFRIHKLSGGTRHILAPEASFKEHQRRILHRLLGRLKAHDAAHGFERGRSIATHARHHVGKALVVRLDLKDFFPSTTEKRVQRYFRLIGWNRKAAAYLTRWCTWEGGLPQGAPTSPRLANLVNRRLDARLTAYAWSRGGTYTRYADDLTFSFADETELSVHDLVGTVTRIALDDGYVVHRRKKLHVMRRHDRQIVTGLVVNDHVALPRSTRRWLRAVEHHVRTGAPASLTEQQLDGWHALQHMVREQGRPRVS